MPNELKPFIHIVYHLYIKYGFTEYPLCKQERIKIDVFTVYGIKNSSDAIWEAKEYIDNLHKEIGGEYV